MGAVATGLFFALRELDLTLGSWMGVSAGSPGLRRVWGGGGGCGSLGPVRLAVAHGDLAHVGGDLGVPISGLSWISTGLPRAAISTIVTRSPTKRTKRTVWGTWP